MEITLGPVLFSWKKEDLVEFYREVAGMPVDRVYLGEVICDRKGNLTPEDMERIGKDLEAAGKKVVVSTLAVVSNEKELELTREVVGLPFAVEANDMSVFNIADEAGGEKDLIAGPHITTYNAPSVEFLKAAGAKRVVFPVELSGESISHVITETGVPGEVFAHGKAPLAFSWRCYTSRAHGLTRTECKRDCFRYPEGMELKSMDGEPVFRANGTSILSALTYTLVEFTDELADMGAAAVRISPTPRNTAGVVDVFRKRLDGEFSPAEALKELEALGEGPFCNGWYLGGAGRDYLAREAAPS